MLIQANVIIVPVWIFIKPINPEYLFQSVFQIQATISTLGITVIGLLTSLFSAKHYGITVTSYVLNMKPKILKHKFFIILSLSFIALDYLFMAFELYNLVFALLISSILIFIRISLAVFWALTQGNSIKYEIHNALLSRLETKKYSYQQEIEIEKVLAIIKYDLEEAVVSNDIVAINDDLSVLEKIITKYTRLLSENYILTSPERLAKDCDSVIYCLLNSGQVNLIQLYLRSIEHIYREFTDIRVHIDIWESVASKFFSILRVVDPTRLLVENSIRDVRKEIYRNITENPNTWKDATSFLPSLFNALSINPYYNKINISLRQQLWKDFVHTDTVHQTDYQWMTDSRFLTKPRSDELFMLLSRVINVKDNLIVSVTCPLYKREYLPVKISVMAYAFCKQYNVFDPTDKEYYSNLYSCFRYRGYKRLSINYIVEHCNTVRKYLNGLEFIESTYQSIPRELILRFMIMYILKHYIPEEANEVAEALNHLYKNEYDKSIARYIFCEGNLDYFMDQLLCFERNIFGETTAKSNDNRSSLRDFCKEYFVELGLIQKNNCQ